MARIPWAQWRPLGPITDEPPITPTVLIYHTMDGYLRGTEETFKQQGFFGTESTWGLGGPWDGTLDGVLWQWQDTHRQADAQYDGNAYANSVETSDGKAYTHPWSSKQLESLIRLTVDWCKLTGNPCKLVTQPTEKGLGYHEQFEGWNKDHHTCPGPIREGQLRMTVIPKARAKLAATVGSLSHAMSTAPPISGGSGEMLAVDGVVGPATIRALQHRLGITVDGIMGPATRVALQRHLGVRSDSVILENTVEALQARIEAAPSGVWDRATTRSLQEVLNAGSF
jgi:peptidoglycan hydrolase-like protein with peptidoglycan-binding domain